MGPDPKVSIEMCSCAAPNVTIRFVFDDTWLFGEREPVVFRRLGMVGHRGRERKIRAGVERRVDVDQVHFAGEFRQQRRQHVFLVAPDQPVAPFFLAEAGRERGRVAAPAPTRLTVSTVWNGSATRNGATRRPASSYLPSQTNSARADATPALRAIPVVSFPSSVCPACRRNSLSRRRQAL